MIPVQQTLFGPIDGNCWAACIASILELPLPCVPHFMRDAWVRHGWNDRGASALTATSAWLREGGYWLGELSRDDEKILAAIARAADARVPFAIMSGAARRDSNVGHSVVLDVYASDLAGALAYFDPHPRKAGLAVVWSLEVIVPLGHAATRELAA